MSPPQHAPAAPDLSRNQNVLPPRVLLVSRTCRKPTEFQMDGKTGTVPASSWMAEPLLRS